MAGLQKSEAVNFKQTKTSAVYVEIFAFLHMPLSPKENTEKVRMWDTHWGHNDCVSEISTHPVRLSLLKARAEREAGTYSHMEDILIILLSHLGQSSSFVPCLMRLTRGLSKSFHYHPSILEHLFLLNIPAFWIRAEGQVKVILLFLFCS